VALETDGSSFSSTRDSKSPGVKLELMAMLRLLRRLSSPPINLSKAARLPLSLVPVIFEKVYVENRLEALRSSASLRFNAARECSTAGARIASISVVTFVAVGGSPAKVSEGIIVSLLTSSTESTTTAKGVSDCGDLVTGGSDKEYLTAFGGAFINGVGGGTFDWAKVSSWSRDANVSS
jgi:hypothetical protein